MILNVTSILTEIFDKSSNTLENFKNEVMETYSYPIAKNKTNQLRAGKILDVRWRWRIVSVSAINFKRFAMYFFKLLTRSTELLLIIIFPGLADYRVVRKNVKLISKIWFFFSLKFLFIGSFFYEFTISIRILTLI